MKVLIFIENNKVPIWLSRVIATALEMDNREVVIINKNLRNRILIFKKYVNRIFTIIENYVFKINSDFDNHIEVSEFFFERHKNITFIKDDQIDLATISDVIFALNSRSVKIEGKSNFNIIHILIENAKLFKRLWIWNLNRRYHLGHFKVVLVNSINNKIISESFLSNKRIWIAKNVNVGCWRAAAMITRLIKYPERLQIEGDEFIDTGFTSLPSFRLSTFNRILNIFIGTLRSILLTIDRFFYQKKWEIYISKNTIDVTKVTDVNDFEKINSPKGKFWADPIIFYDRISNKDWIFIEEYCFQKKIANLQTITINKQLKITSVKEVLDLPYHLSYPFVFEYANRYYMIPETSANKTLDLYESVEWPFNWKFKKTIMSNISTADATVYFDGLKYWMFLSISSYEKKDDFDELYLYSTVNPVEGNWISHPQNPIKSDVRNSRSAGPLFKIEDKLYRPAQDSSVTYGYGLKINLIKNLSDNKYEEELINTINPDSKKGMIANHTLSVGKEYILVDGIEKVRR